MAAISGLERGRRSGVAGGRARTRGEENERGRRWRRSRGNIIWWKGGIGPRPREFDEKLKFRVGFQFFFHDNTSCRFRNRGGNQRLL